MLASLWVSTYRLMAKLIGKTMDWNLWYHTEFLRSTDLPQMGYVHDPHACCYSGLSIIIKLCKEIFLCQEQDVEVPSVRDPTIIQPH